VEIRQFCLWAKLDQKKRIKALANAFSLCIAFAERKFMFLGSSVVEQLTVNQLVAGSNPARGANFLRT
jgi:hypothetical protein